jgi:hypothetical protein
MSKETLSDSNPDGNGIRIRPEKPSLSAVVVIPDNYTTVKTTMNYLKKQTVADQIEIVFVVPNSYQFNPDITEIHCFHSWKIVTIDTVEAIGHSFAAGILEAGAPVVALTEDHSFPDNRWAEIFIKSHQNVWAAVGPSMRNGNPDNLVSWADFYQAYSQWSHPIKTGRIRHLPGHNSSYKRDILLSLGPELKTLMQAESVLHRRLTAQGYELLLEANTCTSHLNFDSWSNWIPARFYAGRQFSGTWSTSWSWLRRLCYTIASPGIPWLRLWRTQKYVRKEPDSPNRITVLLIILAGFIVEATGNMIGFMAGTGNANQRIAYYEYHRLKTNR